MRSSVTSANCNVFLGFRSEDVVDVFDSFRFWKRWRFHGSWQYLVTVKKRLNGCGGVGCKFLQPSCCNPRSDLDIVPGTTSWTSSNGVCYIIPGRPLGDHKRPTVIYGLMVAVHCCPWGCSTPSSHSNLHKHRQCKRIFDDCYCGENIEPYKWETGGFLI